MELTASACWIRSQSATGHRLQAALCLRVALPIGLEARYGGSIYSLVRFVAVVVEERFIVAPPGLLRVARHLEVVHTPAPQTMHESMSALLAYC